MTAIERSGTGIKCAAATPSDWEALLARVENGMATDLDAELLRSIGQRTAARRVERGLASERDAYFVRLALQAREELPGDAQAEF